MMKLGSGTRIVPESWSNKNHSINEHSNEKRSRLWYGMWATTNKNEGNNSDKGWRGEDRKKGKQIKIGKIIDNIGGGARIRKRLRDKLKTVNMCKTSCISHLHGR